MSRRYYLIVLSYIYEAMKKLLLITMWLSTMLIVGCGQQSTNTSSTKTIKVWVIAPLSGPASTYGEDTINAVTIAMTEFNASSKDIKMELVIEDGKCNGSDATSAAQKLITVDNVPIMLGWVCSSEALAASKIAQENNIVNIVAASQSPNISNVGKYVFRYANGISAAKLIGDLADKHFTKIVIVTEKTEFAQSIAAVVREKVWNKIISDIQYDSSEKDFSIIAKRVKQDMSAADAIILIPQSEASITNMVKAFDKEWIQKDFKGKILWYPFLSSPSFIKNAGPLATNLYNVTLGPSLAVGTNAKRYYDQINNEHGIKSILYGWSLALEGTKAIGDAIASGARTSADFYNYFSSITKDNPKQGYLIDSYYFSGSDGVGVPYFLEKIDNGVVSEVKDFN
jgi:ABC-type branched-subunit amino acid transport system substrate-binding protein